MQQRKQAGNPGRRRVVRVEREVPAESRIWLDVGLLMFTVAVSAAFVALALSDDVKVRALELWIVAVAALLNAATCFVAHWDVNRGRKAKRSEVIEERRDHL